MDVTDTKSIESRMRTSFSASGVALFSGVRQPLEQWLKPSPVWQDNNALAIEVGQNVGGVRSSTQNVDGVIAHIVKEFYRHPSVETIFLSKEDVDVWEVWVIIPVRDIEVLRDLVESQNSILRKFFGAVENPPFEIDFHIMYRNQRHTRDLVPRRAIEISKSRQF